MTQWFNTYCMPTTGKATHNYDNPSSSSKKKNAANCLKQIHTVALRLYEAKTSKRIIKINSKASICQGVNSLTLAPFICIPLIRRKWCWRFKIIIQIVYMENGRRLRCYSMKNQLPGSWVLSEAFSWSLPYLSLHFYVVGEGAGRWLGPRECHCMSPASVWIFLYGHSPFWSQTPWVQILAPPLTNYVGPVPALCLGFLPRNGDKDSSTCIQGCCKDYSQWR